jgi:hypothetical protein
MQEQSSLILFNGPRHSGKDEAANYCAKEFGANRFKMSGPIKAAIKAMFALTDEDVDLLETIKTQPSPLLFGLSYVQAQISFSEEWAKKVWGKDVFGRMASAAVQRWERYVGKGNLYVCSDSGFSAEAKSLVYDVISPQNTLLVHLFRTGKSFKGDSRDYIELPEVETINILNNGSIEAYHETLKGTISEWLNRKGFLDTVGKDREVEGSLHPVKDIVGRFLDHALMVPTDETEPTDPDAYMVSGCPSVRHGPPEPFSSNAEYHEFFHG